jgi:S1-C subfamily serine protease
MGLKGVLIARVNRDGAAARAGLRPTRQSFDGDVQWGDLIVAVDGKPIETVDELLTALEQRSVGDEVKLTIIRGLGGEREQSLEISLTLAAERTE